MTMSDSRVRIWFSLFVLAVFGVGLAAGLLIGRRMIPEGVSGRGVFRSPMGPAGIGRAGGPPPGVLLERLTRELDLSPDQRTAVEGVLRASRTRVEQLQRDVRERFDAEQRSLRAEIREELTPEQQERFDRWMERAPRGRGQRGRR